MPKLKPLQRRFFDHSAEHVAQALLGYWLIRNTPQGPCGGRIVETEAYLVDDPACHSYVGQTARNRVMWGPPGMAYVYLIYGNHFCVNVVCQPPGIAEAVLIRAIDASLGLAWMNRHRPGKTPHQLTSGPGKLCAALHINRSFDGTDLCDQSSPIYVATDTGRKSFIEHAGPLVVTQRIGITKAAHLPLRFYLDGSPFVSKRERNLGRKHGRAK